MNAMQTAAAGKISRLIKICCLIKISCVIGNSYRLGHVRSHMNKHIIVWCCTHKIVWLWQKKSENLHVQGCYCVKLCTLVKTASQIMQPFKRVKSMQSCVSVTRSLQIGNVTDRQFGTHCVYLPAEVSSWLASVAVTCNSINASV